MANVICRPELHGSPTREQYDEFHVGLKEFGLERTITRDGKVFRLPKGEYLGVNVTAPFSLLALKINSLAIRITGQQCKLTLTPVSDLAGIYIYGLDEEPRETSFGEELGRLFGSQPSTSTDNGFWTLAALGSGKGAPPLPTGIPDSLQFGFLTGMKR